VLLISQRGAIIAQRFVVEEFVCEGGMGNIYRALDLLLGAPVALKVLSATRPTEEDVERFSREAQLLASLNHSGIVRYIAHGQMADGVAFLALEWLEGENLQQRIARKRLTFSETMLLIRKVAEALACAHLHGIVHRDIKPSNLFLRDGQIDRVSLLDFGIAHARTITRRLTGTGMLIGTPSYMAPEQARGQDDLRPSVDIFALGCVLYECLAGQPPFVGEHLQAILVKILFEPAPPLRALRPDLPESLERLLGEMLSKDPAGRPPHGTALLERLRTLDIQEDAPPESVPASRQNLAYSRTAVEQQLVSVLLASAEGRQALEVTLSPQQVKEQHEHLEPLCKELSSLGMRTEVLADGALVGTLTAEGQAAATDQAERAARCALLVQEMWPEAAVAVATGRGVLDGGLPMGEAISSAIRLLQAYWQRTPATQVMRVILDQATAGLIDSRLRTLPLEGGAVALVGASAAVDETRLLLGQPTPCVGRERDLATLEHWYQGCVEEETPRAVLVLAPPGAGKSRLRHEFLRRVAARHDDVLVLMGRGNLLGAGTPFGPLRQAILEICSIQPADDAQVRRDKLWRRIAQVVPGPETSRAVAFLGELCGVPFPDEADSQLAAARRRPGLMEEGVRWMFLCWLRAECAAQPVLLVLEDLQWGDAATVHLINVALRKLDDQALFVLALGRPEVDDIFPRLWYERVQRLPLEPLSRKASGRLVRQVLGDRVTPEETARIVEHAAGNALYLEELIRAAAEEKGTAMPATVLAMLQSRISRLEGEARQALRAASIFGDACWSGGVSALLGSDGKEAERWLDRLVRSEMLERRPESRFPGQTEYRFRHALMREAAYSLLAEPDRALGHRLAAGYLEGVGEGATVLAYHYEETGEYGKALKCHVAASEDAARLDLLNEARHHHERALRMLARLPQGPALRQLHIDLLLKQVETGLSIDPLPMQRQRLDKARALVEATDEGASSGRIASAAEERLRLSRIDCAWGRVLFHSSRPIEAIQVFRHILTAAEESAEKFPHDSPQGLLEEDLRLTARFGIGLSMSSRGAFGEARVLLEQVLKPLEERGEMAEFSRCLGNYALVLAAVGQYRQAMAEFERALLCITPISQPSVRIRYWILQASTHLCAAEWPAVRAATEVAQDLDRHCPESAFHYLPWDLMAWAESQLGEHEAAFEHRARAQEIRAAVGGGMARDWFEAGEAEMLLRAARVEEARQRAQQVATSSRQAGLPFSEAIAERVWACALSRQGAELDEIEAHFRNALAICQANQQIVNAAQTEVAWGRVLCERGERAAGELHLQRGIADLEAAGCDYAAQAAREPL
jgi:serine/threonine protein kinase/tetratricopeptide (TPR) repeat protein